MTAVLDTNILVSAALASAKDRWSRARWLVKVAFLAQRRFEHMTSAPMMRELRAVLARPEMLHGSNVDGFADAIAGMSTFVHVHNVPMGCRDPDDDKVIETAMNANADFVVSNDADVHAPSARYAIAKTGIGIRSRPIRVVTLDEFVAELTGTPGFSPLIVEMLAA